MGISGGSFYQQIWGTIYCELHFPVSLTPLFILTLLMLCGRWGVDICFCWEDPGWDALMHKLTHMCARTSLSALLHTSARKPKAEAASRSRPCSLLILTHFLFPAHHSLFNCRAAHWGHLLDWGPSPWRCWEAFRIYCGLTNREMEVREWG